MNGLPKLLDAARRAGAEELRLIPGRRAQSVKRGVASDVGEATSADAIDEAIEPFLTSDSRMDLALGSAEWTADVNGFGAVVVRAELRSGEMHVSFVLAASRRESSAPPAEAEFEGIDLLEGEDEATEIDVDPLDPGDLASATTSMPPVFGMAVSAAAKPAPVAKPPAAKAHQSPPRSDPEAASMPPVLGAPGSGLSDGQKQALARARAAPPSLAQQAPPAAPPAAAPAPPPAAAQAPVQPQVLSLPAPVQSPEIREASLAPAALASVRPAGSPREIHALLMATLQARGSDLHLSSGVQPMIRIDGEMRPMTVRGPLNPQALEQLLWPIVPERSRAEFQKRKDADFAVALEGYARFRGNIFVDRNGIGAVFRVIPNQIVPAERLGLPPEVLRLCQLPKGLVLVTGPTGSGKSTTLASLIDYINRTRSVHVVTIEDPIEFVFENKKCLVNQREVGTHTNSFRAALRAALREDPDVLFVGEMRDLETIEIAIETAETGHLVFATLHTTSAPGAVDRIIDQFPAERQNQIRIMLAESLKGVVAQMLCRRNGGGRVAAFEVLFGIPAVAHLIRDRKVFQLPSIMQTGAKLGMRLMNDSLADLVKRGLVTPEEALSKSQDRTGLTSALKELKIDA